MIYFIADLHFFHENILKYEPSRLELGSNASEMNEEIIKRFNETVSKEDTTFLLGDATFTDLSPISRLNGSIVFIKGNHDRISRRKALNIDNVIYFSKKPIQVGSYLLSHEPINTDLVNIHGHIHSNTLHEDFDPNTHVCVSIERLGGFRPVSVEALRIDSRPFEEFLKTIDTD
jgi:calcineurin-like phosphoesterase family protein